MADEFSDKLNAVLGNPEAMGQIMSIARALSGEGGASQPQPDPAPQSAPQEPYQPEPQPPAPVQPQSAPSFDLGAVMNMLGSLTGGGGSSGAAPASGGSNPLSALSDIDPRILQTGMRLLSEYNSNDDRKTALLTALRPFVKEERFAKVDRAIQIAKLSRIIRVALQVFKESGGGEGLHV